MMEADENLIMTGRSESAIDEEEEVAHHLEKGRSINCSYINLKRNNLLVTFAQK